MAQQLLTNFTPPGSTSSYKFRAGGLFFGTSSGTNSAMKVSIPGVSEYYNGLTIILTIGDTITPASNCTLAINNLGAKPIKYGYNGDASHFSSGATYLFVYDGTNFKGIHSENIDTTYQSMDLNAGKAGTDDTIGALLTPYRLKQIINNFAPTKTGGGASGDWNINSATANKFQEKTNVSLTGDVTGTYYSAYGWTVPTQITDGAVTNAKLAGEITNDKLANPSFAIQHGGVDYPISLGDVVSSTDLSSWLGLTNYSAGTGLVLNGTTFNHSNSITAKTSYAQNTTSAPGYAGTFKVFEPKYDAQGHITGVRTTTVTMPSAQTIPTSFNITANGSDDGIVTLSKSGGANQVSYSVAHKKVFGASTTSTNKYSSSNTTTSITSSGTIKIPQISVDEYGHVYAAADENVTITMPTALKNPKALTVGSKTYDGSAAITIAASDLGLSNALHFIGVKDAIPTSGTYANGDVILVGNKEYVYSNSAWIELGDESSFALKTVTISGANGLTGSGTLAGNITLSHADTSSQGSVSASGRRYITGVTLDDYGHVTGLTTGTETVTNTHYTTKLFATSSSGTAHAATTNGNTYLRLFDSDTARQSIKIVGSGATKVTSDANGVITITSTDNNTVYTHPAGSAASKENKLYKFATDSNSHISEVTEVTKADITALGIPGQDTWVANTASSAGYVASGSGQANKVWKTNADGVPGWRSDSNTTYKAGTGLTLSSTTFSVSTANASTIIGLLSEATADMTANGYIITSDASDTTTGLFYKRPANKIVNATLVKSALGTGTGTTKYLREDGTWVVPPNTTYSAATTSAAGLMSAADKTKLNGIASGAEVNQNAFSNIIIGSTTISADTKTDSLTLVGSNVTLTPDATNDKVTIGITKENVVGALGYTPPDKNTTYGVVSTTADGLAPKRDGSTATFLRGDGTWAVPPDTKYTHPTSSGNKHIPSGGSSGQILRWSADGTAVWGNDNNTTYSAGTGISFNGTTINHSNSIIAGTAKGSDTKTLGFGGTFTIPSITFDAQGHITGHTTTTMTMPANPNSAHSHSAGVGLTGSGNAGTSGTYTYKVNLVNEAVASNAASYTAGGSSKFYAVQLDKNNKLGVYVPWSNTHAVSSVNSKTGAVTLDYSDVGASKAITSITRNGTTFTATHLDGTTTTFTQQDNNTTYSNMTAATADAAGKAGLVPAPAAGKQGQFLRGDGTWATPTNTTYTAMTGATASAAGKSGLVPAPAAGKQNSFLRGDGAWATPTNTTYTFATGDSNGQIKITPSGGTAINVSVKGLGSAAYTASTAYDAAGAANTALANAKTYTDTKVAALVDSAPETLDTLNELAAALGDDPNFATTIATSIGTKANSSVTITAGNGLTGGGNLTANRTIAVGAGAGISVTADAVALATSGVTKGSYGPSANVTGSSGATVNIPYITVDEYGRVTSASTKTYTTMTVDSAMSASSTNPVQNKVIKAYVDSKAVDTSSFLPRSAGVNYPLTGPLGLTKDVMYGPTLPSANTFNGQLFFLEDSGAALPAGGTADQVLVKNSNEDGDASWKALPIASASASGIVTTGTQTFAGAKTFSSSVTFANTTMNTVGDDSAFGDADIAGAFVIQGLNGNTNLSFKQYNGNNIANITYNGSNLTSSVAFYGAVWNDYAEFRTQKEIIQPGYCVASADNGQVYKTTEKFQACDGIVSDTFGFAIGETDECKTPLAVAGRVLAYFHGNREDYHAGDTVCAGPEGKVMKMTREEIRECPDRIIGIVSEIPEYKTWGTGNVEVNGRIWIKVK